MTVSVKSIAVVGILAGLSVTQAHAQSNDADFKGKTVQFFVGYEPGGGYDTYTRAGARYIGKHLPRQPNVIVNNMPGASSLTFVRYLQAQTPKDGTQRDNSDLAPRIGVISGAIDITAITKAHRSATCVSKELALTMGMFRLP